MCRADGRECPPGVRRALGIGLPSWEGLLLYDSRPGMLARAAAIGRRLCRRAATGQSERASEILSPLRRRRAAHNYSGHIRARQIVSVPTLLIVTDPSATLLAARVRRILCVNCPSSVYCRC